MDHLKKRDRKGEKRKSTKAKAPQWTKNVSDIKIIIVWTDKFEEADKLIQAKQKLMLSMRQIYKKTLAYISDLLSLFSQAGDIFYYVV